MNSENATTRKIFWRVMPLILAGSFLSNLDRLNISFAAVRMNDALGLSAAQFGLAISAFFVGYVIVGVPGNLILERVGARKWFGFLLIAWGLLSCATGFVRGLGDLVLVRFLLGLAEGSYPPGVLIFLTFWIPPSHRGRFVGWVAMAQSVGTIAAPLLSGLIVGIDSVAGLPGWRMMFVLQGLPTSLVGLLVWRFLADRPGEARWLTGSERAWLTASLDPPRKKEAGVGVARQLAGVLNGRFAMMAAIYLLITICGYGSITFLPLIFKSLGYSIPLLGLFLSIPSLVAVLVAPLWGRWSDKAGRKEYPCIGGCLVMAGGFAGMAFFNGTPIAILACCVALVGVGGAYITFWPSALTALEGPAAASAVALLYAIGSIGGIVSPYVFGLLKDLTSDFSLSLLALAGVAGIAAIFVLGNRIVAMRQATVLAPEI